MGRACFINKWNEQYFGVIFNRSDQDSASLVKGRIHATNETAWCEGSTIYLKYQSSVIQRVLD